MASPPPIKLKQSQSTSAAQTLTASSSSLSAHDARLLVRETLRISANLASSNSNATESPPLSLADSVENQSRNRRRLGLVEEEYVNSSLRLICCEEIDGRRWNYVAEKDSLSGTFRKGSIRALTMHTPPAPVEVQFCFSHFFQILYLCVYIYIYIRIPVSSTEFEFEKLVLHV